MSGVRSSLPVINISERTDREIGKVCSPQHDVYKYRFKCYLNWPLLRLLLHGFGDGWLNGCGKRWNDIDMLKQ